MKRNRKFPFREVNGLKNKKILYKKIVEEKSRQHTRILTANHKTRASTERHQTSKAEDLGHYIGTKFEIPLDVGQFPMLNQIKLSFDF